MDRKIPLIGLSTYGSDGGGRFWLPREYADVVIRAGAWPVLLPPMPLPVAPLLGRLDGLILCGGGDLDPGLYRGRRHETLYGIDRERDEFELALACDAIAIGLPILGICRGMQVINVALGGDLHEHLPDVAGAEVAHRADPNGPIFHPVRLRALSRLAEAVGPASLETASWHHQAIRCLGKGLTVVAEAADGVVEAMELPAHPWLVGVQWHPELGGADHSRHQALIDAFVLAAAAWRGYD